MAIEYRTIRIDNETLKIVDKIREETGVPISRYVKLAIMEKMERDNNRKKAKSVFRKSVGK